VPLEPALRIVAFGDVDQRLLERLRSELGLGRSGRLSDDEDVVMGSRFDNRPNGDLLHVWLSRQAPGTWSFWVAFDGAPPSEEYLDEQRARFLAAIEGTGLVVNREWRRS
jgi:hypothetical protein